MINYFSNRIEKLKILYIYNETIDNFLNSYYFPNLLELEISNCKLTRLEKKMFDEFQLLQSLKIHNNSELLKIEKDVFSNLKQLTCLDLSFNRIESLDKRTFLELVNLETLNLSKNQLEFVDENIFSSLKKLKNLDLSRNKLEKLDPKSFVGVENVIRS